MELKSTIKNPLTVIAIFAGIAEVSGTSVLPFLDSSLQATFLWFVIGFPCLLVLLFFLTLNFNHRVLYAPSDYRDDSFFIQASSGVRAIKRGEKLSEELMYEEEAEKVENSELTKRSHSDDVMSFSTSQSSDRALQIASERRTRRATHFLAEELVLNRLSEEIDGQFSRESMVAGKGGDYMFDAIITKGGNLTAIEVKYFPSVKFSRSIVRFTLERIHKFYSGLSLSERDGFSLVFAVATDAPTDEHGSMTDRLHDIAREFDMPISIRIFDLKELEKNLY